MRKINYVSTKLLSLVKAARRSKEQVMTYTLIKGSFHVTNYQPDGDSIRFKPDNIQLLANLSGHKPNLNARNHAQLRIEAIDALEIHYSPQHASGIYHQPLQLAFAARDDLLDFVGIKEIQWGDAGRLALSARDQTRGYILSRTADRYGRPISFVFSGDTKRKDGENVLLDKELLRKSYNFRALQKGLAYPTFYNGLFGDLREECTGAAQSARRDKAGIYKIDVTNSGFDVSTLHAITDGVAILPKLFRRVVDYIVYNGSAIGFKDKLAQAQEPVFDLTTNNFTHLDTFIKQSDDGNFISLTRPPETLVFDEMKTRGEHMLFSALLGNDDALRFK
jgi:hypothetical protein